VGVYRNWYMPQFFGAAVYNEMITIGVLLLTNTNPYVILYI
jgi:hypothetical protein